MSESQIIPLIPLIFIAIAMIAGLFVLASNAQQPLKMLAQLWIIVFTAEVMGRVVIYFEYDNNYPIYNLLQFILFFFLAIIYFEVLQNENVRNSIRIFFGVLLVFVLINSLFIQGIFNFQTLTRILGCIFILYLAGAYLWQLYISQDNDKITADPFFWLSFGLIFYYGGTTPFIGMLNYMNENFPDFTMFYRDYISNAFSIFLNILVTVAFYVGRIK